MNEWDLLRQLCPKLFKHGLCFECAMGWYKLLHYLSLDLERIIERHEEKYKAVEGEEGEYFEMYAVQIKEKYGTLRFYMSCETDEMSELIRQAEMASREVCEMCGEPGKWRNISWCTVRCDKCYKEIEE